LIVKVYKHKKSIISFLAGLYLLLILTNPYSSAFCQGMISQAGINKVQASHSCCQDIITSQTEHISEPVKSHCDCVKNQPYPDNRFIAVFQQNKLVLEKLSYVNVYFFNSGLFRNIFTQNIKHKANLVKNNNLEILRTVILLN